MKNTIVSILLAASTLFTPLQGGTDAQIEEPIQTLVEADAADTISTKSPYDAISISTMISADRTAVTGSSIQVEPTSAVSGGSIQIKDVDDGTKADNNKDTGKKKEAEKKAKNTKNKVTKEKKAKRKPAKKTIKKKKSVNARYAKKGETLTKSAGVFYGPCGKETYYNLDMSGVVSMMRHLGNDDEYWVREDGVKMLGDYVMVAASLDKYDKGDLVNTSLGKGIVCDTGGFAKNNRDQFDIAVTW